jgi:hypothetical protein
VKHLLCKVAGTLCITIAVFALVFRICGWNVGARLGLLWWFVDPILLLVGVILLRQGGSLEGWSGGARDGARTR